MSTTKSIKNFINAGEGDSSSFLAEAKLNIPHKNTYNGLKKFKVNGIGLLLMPVILFEVFVCLQSFNYYNNSLKFSVLGALSVSLCIESFYMYFSSQRGIQASILKTLFLGISIFTLGFNTYSTDENLLSYKSNLSESKTEIKKKIDQLDLQLKSYNQERKTIEKQMEVYIKNELITKGNRVLSPRRIQIDKSIKAIRGEQEALSRQLKSNGSNMVSIGIVKQIDILTMKTLVTIVVFALIQVAICISLPDIIGAFKNPHKNTIQ